VGLDYVRLGQSAPTLSGGEAQRVKLAAELARPDTGRTLYLLDEPTTGLHFDDLAKLIDVLHRLVDLGNSVVLIEHNLDVIKCADWVIDMGPEAGADGGRVVAAGTPEMVAEYARRALSPAGKRDALPRSYTGEFLQEVLERDQRTTRNATLVVAERSDPVADFRRLAKDVSMPWETNGRRWHTRDRLARDGKPAEWDGEILSRVVDYIVEHSDLSEPDWSNRSVVEIAPENKSLGWFFHAITGDRWLLKMKFRVRRGTFQKSEIAEKLPLKTLNQLDEIPRYSNQPRVRLRQQGPVQEIEIQAHTLAEIDVPAFWSMLDTAIASFQQRLDRVDSNREEHMPWTKLGRKWHFMPKGFSAGPIQWNFRLLEELERLFTKLAPEGMWLWNHKQIVHFSIPQQREPWLSVQTKKPGSLWLHLNGPKDSVRLGRISEIATDASITDLGPRREVVHFKIKAVSELKRPALLQFFQEHLAAVNSAQANSKPGPPPRSPKRKSQNQKSSRAER
jgi:excinuclease ABC subunit A